MRLGLKELARAASPPTLEIALKDGGGNDLIPRWKLEDIDSITVRGGYLEALLRWTASYYVVIPKNAILVVFCDDGKVFNSCQLNWTGGTQLNPTEILELKMRLHYNAKD